MNRVIIDDLCLKINSSENKKDKSICLFLTQSYLTHFTELRSTPLWIREFLDRLSTFKKIKMENKKENIQYIKISEDFLLIYIDEVIEYFKKYSHDPLINELREGLIYERTIIFE